MNKPNSTNYRKMKSYLRALRRWQSRRNRPTRTSETFVVEGSKERYYRRSDGSVVTVVPTVTRYWNGGLV